MGVSPARNALRPGLDGAVDPGNAGAMSDDHFDPVTYREWVRDEVPHYDHLQESIAAATGAVEASAILDLGTGTGETLGRVLARHPSARAIGVDESDGMLAVAQGRLEEYGSRCRWPTCSIRCRPAPSIWSSRPWRCTTSTGPGKATLFARVADALRPGGRFVLGDVILPPTRHRRVIPLTDDWDKPSTVADQVRWMEEAGLAVTVPWQEDDLALFIADRPPA